jgi:hypothetical protein
MDGEETFKNLFLTKLQNHLPDHPLYTKIKKIQQMETLEFMCLALLKLSFLTVKERLHFKTNNYIDLEYLCSFLFLLL